MQFLGKAHNAPLAMRVPLTEIPRSYRTPDAQRLCNFLRAYGGTRAEATPLLQLLRRQPNYRLYRAPVTVRVHVRKECSNPDDMNVVCRVTVVLPTIHRHGLSRRLRDELGRALDGASVGIAQSDRATSEALWRAAGTIVSLDAYVFEGSK